MSKADTAMTEKPLKILYLSHIARMMGGGEFQILETAVGVIEKGHKAHVVCHAENTKFQGFLKSAKVPYSLMTPMGIPMLPAQLRLAIWLWRALPRLCAQFGPDLICTNTLLTTLVAAITRARLNGKLIYAAMVSKRPKRFDPFYRFIAKKLDGVMYNSSYTRSSYKSVFGGVGHDLVNYSIVAAPDSKDLDPKKIIDLRTKQLNGAKYMIGFVGRITPKKAVDYFLAAAKKLADQGLDAKFVIVGDNDPRFPQYCQAVRQQAENDMPGKVSFLGHVDEIYPFMAGLDALLITSSGEGFGRAGVEAAYLGVPAVGTTPGGIVEVLEHHPMSAIVPCGQPDQMAKATWHLIKKFSVDTTNKPDSAATIAQAFGGKILVERELKFYRSIVEKRE